MPLRVVVACHAKCNAQTLDIVYRNSGLKGTSMMEFMTERNYSVLSNAELHTKGKEEGKKGVDIVVNMVPKHIGSCTSFVKSTAVVNPLSATKLVRDPAAFHKFLAALHVDHARVVSSGTYPAMIHGTCNVMTQVHSPIDEKVRRGAVRLEYVHTPVQGVTLGDVWFYVHMMHDEIYFLTAVPMIPTVMDKLCYIRCVAEGMRAVHANRSTFTKIQAASKIATLRIAFGLRSNGNVCIFAVDYSLVSERAFQVLTSYGLGDGYITHVRDSLTCKDLSWDLLLPGKGLRENVIVGTPPKTGGTTVNHFLMTTFRHTYVLVRYNDERGYRFEDRHGKDATLPRDTNVLILTTHHDTRVLQGMLPDGVFDNALKYFTARNVYTRVHSIHRGRSRFRNLDFSTFAKKHLRGHCAVKPKDYVNMDIRTAALIHTTPQSAYLCVMPHNKVIHMETMAKGVKELVELVERAADEKVSVDYEHVLSSEGVGRRNARGRYTPPPMDENTRSIVDTFYSKDIAIGLQR